MPSTVQHLIDGKKPPLTILGINDFGSVVRGSMFGVSVDNDGCLGGLTEEDSPPRGDQSLRHKIKTLRLKYRPG